MAQSILIRKLLIKPGQRMTIINPPAGYLDNLGALPEGVELVAKPHGSPLDFVHLFVKDKAELENLAPGALDILKPDAIFWVSYPKGGSQVKTDLNRDILWKLMEKKGLAGVAMISIDEVWSAMRFRPAGKVGRSKK
jgi:hypothetical protein